ncbi:hypothetical protein RHGRI_036317 [Rhododendron griersonianum]|uniref:Ubiquitin fusion degradaton protein n=1 Tax=Rhododendron griersonianum TaxID=479676 RepID=A0AAV6HT78_9ERIC|nr:hypothetical protein RHGRI_036317 [Rhododendron griersonianum]
MYEEGYGVSSSTFEQSYRCYPVSFIEKVKYSLSDLNFILAAYLQIDYPMVFELNNPSGGKITHCGVLEFTADEGLIYLPYWMMENMILQEGDILHIKNASLSKGTYVKLQPHTKDFIDLANPKAILETTLRNYSCLTTGDTIMVAYNNKRYYIDVVETKPSFGISIIETDCEVDFAPPLDYKEPEKPAQSNSSKKSQKTPREVQEEEPANKIAKFSAFSGSAKRLDGKASVESVPEVSSPMLKQHQPKVTNGASGSASSSSSRQRPGKLVFGSNSDQPPNGKPKATSKDSSQELSEKKEEPKFQAFTGKKYSLKGFANRDSQKAFNTKLNKSNA